MTPSDAPYKLAQRESEAALRASRRVLRLDRGLMVAFAKRLPTLVRRDGVLSPRAAAMLRSLRAMLTRAERREAGL